MSKKTKPKTAHLNRYERFSKAKSRQVEIELSRRGLIEPLSVSGSLQTEAKPSLKQSADKPIGRPARISAHSLDFIRRSLPELAQNNSNPESAHALFFSRLMTYGIPALPPEVDQEVHGAYMQAHVNTVVAKLEALPRSRWPDDTRARIQKSVEALDRYQQIELLLSVLGLSFRESLGLKVSNAYKAAKSELSKTASPPSWGGGRGTRSVWAPHI